MNENQSPKTVTIEVDNESLVVEKGTMTAAAIVEMSGKDPATHYLIEVQGRHQVAYKDQPNELVKVHENSKFATACSGPTTVSGE